MNELYKKQVVLISPISLLRLEKRALKKLVGCFSKEDAEYYYEILDSTNLSFPNSESSL